MLKATRLLLCTCIIGGLGEVRALAKGLEELSDRNPETAPPEEPEPATAEGESAEKAAEGGESPDTAQAKAAPSALSKTLGGKAFVFTSVGWVKGSQSTGAWRTSGFSDFGIGYGVLPVTSVMNLSLTYRYVPVAVSGTSGGYSYRGVWETHGFGGMLKIKLPRRFLGVVLGELGYLRSHMRSVDGLSSESGVVKNGAMLTIGGGADYLVSEGGEFTVGPRLYLGGIAATQVQLAVACGFGF